MKLNIIKLLISLVLPIFEMYVRVTSLGHNIDFYFENQIWVIFDPIYQKINQTRLKYRLRNK